MTAVTQGARGILLVCQGDLKEEELLKASQAGLVLITPALVKPTQEDCFEFQVSLGKEARLSQ